MPIKIEKNKIVAEILSLTQKKELSAEDIYALKTAALSAGLLIEQLDKERLKLVKSCRDLAKQRFELLRSTRQADSERKASENFSLNGGNKDA